MPRQLAKHVAAQRKEHTGGYNTIGALKAQYWDR